MFFIFMDEHILCDRCWFRQCPPIQTLQNRTLTWILTSIPYYYFIVSEVYCYWQRKSFLSISKFSRYHLHHFKYFHSNRKSAMKTLNLFSCFFMKIVSHLKPYCLRGEVDRDWVNRHQCEYCPWSRFKNHHYCGCDLAEQ